MQLSFELPDVDKKATKKAVEKAFEAYNMYKPMKRVSAYEGMPGMNNLVASYPRTDADMIHGQNPDRSAAAAINKYVDRTLMIERMEQVVGSLPPLEKEIIQSTMMKAEDCRVPDSVLMDELGLGKTKYYEVKWKAMLRVAFALRIEVMLPAKSA